MSATLSATRRGQAGVQSSTREFCVTTTNSRADYESRAVRNSILLTAFQCPPITRPRTNPLQKSAPPQNADEAYQVSWAKQAVRLATWCKSLSEIFFSARRCTRWCCGPFRRFIRSGAFAIGRSGRRRRRPSVYQASRWLRAGALGPIGLLTVPVPVWAVCTTTANAEVTETAWLSALRVFYWRWMFQERPVAAVVLVVREMESRPPGVLNSTLPLDPLVHDNGKPQSAFISRNDNADSTDVTPGRLRIWSRMKVP